MTKKKWTDEERAFVKVNYSVMFARDIAKFLNRTESSVHHEAQQLGVIACVRNSKKNGQSFQKWSSNEIENLIRDAKSGIDIKQLEKKYNRGRISIYHKLKEHNVNFNEISMSRTRDIIRIKVERYVTERGGKCLNLQDYKTQTTRLHIDCGKGHLWITSWGGIKQNNWCHYCSSSIGEELCRFYFETFLQKSFPTTHPKWLNGLELDGYNTELKIAFEYQGPHHYDYVTYCGKQTDFPTVQNRDEIKRRKCIEMNVRLIEIPHTVKNDNIGTFIASELKLQITEMPQPPNLDYRLIKLSDTIKKKGGLLLTKLFVGNHAKMEIDCGKGHVFKMNSYDVMHGHWCTYCVRGTLTDVQVNEIVRLRNIGESITSISEKLNVERHTVRRVLRKKSQT